MSHKRSVSKGKSKKAKSLSPDRLSTDVILDIPPRTNRIPSSSLHLDAENAALMNADSDAVTETENVERDLKLQATHSATGTMVTYQSKVAKPEDYDEIHIEPVDAMDYVSPHKKGFHIDANVVAIGPTRT